ncbi:MAG: hypothetical protein M0P64_02400 [Candidatus Pacebacteria bacterium]|jgi:hypothetical protein|nr:hypothetical protein [Candidatus Paceibacterota bacterium]
MDFQYVEGHAAIDVSFKPEEIDDAIDVLKEFIIEAEEMKMHIPAFAPGFFEKLSLQTSETVIRFSFGYLEFSMNFLQKAFIIIPKEDDDVAMLGRKLERLWIDVAPYCVRDSMLQ